MRRERILVTGSGGLIGSALCTALSARGHLLRRFDIRDHPGGLDDITSPAALERALEGCTGVIHLAAVSRVIWGERDPRLCGRTNVEGTGNLVALLRARDPMPWLIFASSREVYGDGETLPVTEAAPLAPMNHYARSKVAAERLVTQAVAGGLRAAIVRFSTVYGAPDDHADRVIPAFCRAALAGHPLRVEGKANCLDITHVADVAGCVADLAGRFGAGGGALAPMHLTTGRATSLLALAQMVRRLANSDSAIVTAPARDYDVTRFAGDPALAARLIGWRPTTPLQAGLAELIARLRAGRAASSRPLHDTAQGSRAGQRLRHAESVPAARAAGADA